MAGRIPDSYVEQVLARTDIVELIGARVALRRSGAEFSARCPFHEERSPSFTVSPAKQFYHCFGCGAHGSAIGFLMAHDRLEFQEAVRDLASRAGLPPPEQDDAPRPRTDESLYPVLERAGVFFRAQLRRHPAAGRAVDYLKGRGLTGTIAARFGIGFAPPGGSGLIEALHDVPADALERAGLSIERQGRRIDKFRDRVMFPIHDERGRVVAFGGRVLGDGTPKYLNSPETPVFHKGRVLYNLDRVLKLRPAPTQLLVVEGYMDVVALAQFGIENVVATLGTAATTEHLRRAFRVCPEVVFCFDGDSAGERAAGRAIENVMAEMHDGRQARFIFLPSGDDPDTLVRRSGASAVRDVMAQARPLSEELFARLQARADVGTDEGRARVVDLARPLVARLPSGVFRTLILQRLARLARLSEAQLGAHIAGRPARIPVRSPLRRASTSTPTLVRHLAKLLAQHPQLANDLGPEWASLDGTGEAGFLLRLAQALRDGPALGLGGLIERWRDTEDGAQLATLLAGEPSYLDETAACAELARGIAALRAAAERQARQDSLRGLLRDRGPADMTDADRQALGAALPSGTGEQTEEP